MAGLVSGSAVCTDSNSISGDCPDPDPLQFGTDIEGRFLNFLQASPDFSQRVYKALSLEVLDQTIALSELACGPLKVRLEHLLLHLSKHMPVETKEARRVFPLKRVEIADILHVSPRHLSRTLCALAKQNKVRIRGAWIEIRSVGDRNEKRDDLSLRAS